MLRLVPIRTANSLCFHAGNTPRVLTPQAVATEDSGGSAQPSSGCMVLAADAGRVPEAPGGGPGFLGLCPAGQHPRLWIPAGEFHAADAGVRLTASQLEKSVGVCPGELWCLRHVPLNAGGHPCPLPSQFFSVSPTFPMTRGTRNEKNPRKCFQ